MEFYISFQTTKFIGDITTQSLQLSPQSEPYQLLPPLPAKILKMLQDVNCNKQHSSHFSKYFAISFTLLLSKFSLICKRPTLPRSDLPPSTQFITSFLLLLAPTLPFVILVSCKLSQSEAQKLIYADTERNGSSQYLSFNIFISII